MLSSETARKTVTILPPEHVARPWKRILARALDIILVQIIGVMIAIVFVLGNGIITSDQINELGSISNFTSIQTSCPTLVEPGCRILQVQTEFTLYSYIMIAIISMCYFIVTTKLSPNATLGKYILGLQIVSTRGTSITWMQSIMRHLPWLLVDILVILFLLYSLDSGRIIPQANMLQTVFYALIIVQMYLTEWAQGIHDMISATAVITSNPQNKQGE